MKFEISDGKHLVKFWGRTFQPSRKARKNSGRISEQISEKISETSFQISRLFSETSFSQKGGANALEHTLDLRSRRFALHLSGLSPAPDKKGDCIAMRAFVAIFFACYCQAQSQENRPKMGSRRLSAPGLEKVENPKNLLRLILGDNLQRLK